MIRGKMEAEDRAIIVMTEYTGEDCQDEIPEKKLDYEKYKNEGSYSIVLSQHSQPQQQHAHVEVCLAQADVNGNTGVTKTQVVVPPSVVITGATEDETEDAPNPEEFKPYTIPEMCLLWTVDNPRLFCLLIIVVSFVFTFLLTFVQYFA